MAHWPFGLQIPVSGHLLRRHADGHKPHTRAGFDGTGEGGATSGPEVQDRRRPGRGPRLPGGFAPWGGPQRLVGLKSPSDRRRPACSDVRIDETPGQTHRASVALHAVPGQMQPPSVQATALRNTVAPRRRSRPGSVDLLLVRWPFGPEDAFGTGLEDAQPIERRSSRRTQSKDAITDERLFGGDMARASSHACFALGIRSTLTTIRASVSCVWRVASCRRHRSPSPPRSEPRRIHPMSRYPRS